MSSFNDEVEAFEEEGLHELEEVDELEPVEEETIEKEIKDNGPQTVQMVEMIVEKQSELEKQVEPEHPDVDDLSGLLTEFPEVSSRYLSQHKKKEAAEQFQRQAIQTKRRIALFSKAIDPTDRRFYLLSNSELLAAIQEVCDEIGFVLSSFIEYLVLPQSGEVGPMRRGYFEISRENIEEQFIKLPVVSDKMMNYVLCSILPYESIQEYDVIDVADVQDHLVEPYEVKVQDETIRVEPQMLFTNEELESKIRVSKSCKNILSSALQSSREAKATLLTKEACGLWRTFIKRLVHALQLFVPSGSDMVQYREVARQLQNQTWIVRGVEMGRPEKLRNALVWIMSAGTDWLEKREIDPYDIEFAVSVLLGDIGKDYRNRILQSGKNGVVKDTEFLREYLIDNDLLIDLPTLKMLCRILDKIMSLPELLEWIDERLNMFAQV